MSAGGGFTLPGEAGREALTLELARRWGADVIRDSDGTELSPEITQAGYGIYSTLCVIRGHNEWAFRHPDTLQQTFLSTPDTVARERPLRIPLLKRFFPLQFRINAAPESLRLWQVWDRTENRLLSADEWYFDSGAGEAVVTCPVLFHAYTVSFLAHRIWEEISMYNHVTNHWNTEHLQPLDPVYPEVQDYLAGWLDSWCDAHPATTVVRFTSLFYNFVWIWGADEQCRNLFTDWASYDFTVSPRMLEAFAQEYGYALTAEDFINGGRLQPTHRPPTPHKRDYMDFVQRFVAGFGRRLVDIVHRHGKQAYLFYDDSWVGSEPYGPYFAQMNFDGLIKCVFSGFEARMCAEADVPVHELRLHPYLFPVGLGGAPTFSPGGDPALEARRYWVHVRRALLRRPVDRIGLGGYLHLVEGFPDFCTAMDDIVREFRTIRDLHTGDSPAVLPFRVAVLHAWGSLRSWTLSGHFHETDAFDLIHINEALSGLPLDVRFLSFDDVRRGALRQVDVLINAGSAQSAWSGGEAWADPELVTLVTQWVDEGGVLIGVNEPSAADGFDTRLRLAPVLGVEVDDGARACHGSWQIPPDPVKGLVVPGSLLLSRSGVMILSGDVRVLAEQKGLPVLTERCFGRGRAFYLSRFRFSFASARTLLNLILYSRHSSLCPEWIPDNPLCECAFYPASGTLALVNNSDREQTVSVRTPDGSFKTKIAPFELYTFSVQK